MNKTKVTSTRLALKNLLKNKSILITGGAGSLGNILTEKLLTYPIKQVRVLDINEHALFQVKRKFNDKRLRILFGSITDLDRIEMACNGIDIIIPKGITLISFKSLVVNSYYLHCYNYYPKNFCYI